MEEYTQKQCVNDDLGDVFYEEAQLPNMNDDLYGSEGPSSCAESFPDEEEQEYHEPAPQVEV